MNNSLIKNIAIICLVILLFITYGRTKSLNNQIHYINQSKDSLEQVYLQLEKSKQGLLDSISIVGKENNQYQLEINQLESELRYLKFKYNEEINSINNLPLDSAILFLSEYLSIQISNRE